MYSLQPGSEREACVSSPISLAACSSSPSRAVILTVSTNAISLLPDRVGQAAEALDLDRHLVAVGQQSLRLPEDADAGRRARRDQVAPLERDRLAHVRDDLRDG